MGFGPKGIVLARIFESDLENGRAHYNKIRRGAVRIRSVGEDNADDFVQDFYLSVLKAAEGYKYDITEDMVGKPIMGNLNTWLWDRHKWLGVDYGTELLRRRPLSLVEREDRDGDAISNDCLIDNGDSVSEKMIEDAERDAVRSEVECLPIGWRNLLYLRYYMGMKIKDIAKYTDMLCSSVNYQLKMARKQLSKRTSLVGLME